MGYLNHKYLYQGYPRDFLFQRGPCRLESLAVPLALVATALFAPSFATAMCRSSVSATDRPPRRGLPRSNCHSHWLISHTLLPFLPNSSGSRSAWKADRSGLRRSQNMKGIPKYKYGISTDKRRDLFSRQYITRGIEYLSHRPH